MKAYKDKQGEIFTVMTFSEFRDWCIEEVVFYGSNRKAAKRYNENSGLFTQVIEYHQESPTLRKAMKCPLHPPRTRLTIQDPTGELTAAMDSQRGSQSREDYQRHLLALDRGELPY